MREMKQDALHSFILHPSSFILFPLLPYLTRSAFTLERIPEIME